MFEHNCLDTCYFGCLIHILFYSTLCPSTAGSSPLPEFSNFLCPLLSLSIPLPVAPQCHLSNDVLVFQLILHALSSVLLIVHRLSFILAMCPAHFHFALVTYWTMPVTGSLPNGVLRILSLSLTLSISFPWIVGVFQVSLVMFGIHMSLLVRHTG